MKAPQWLAMHVLRSLLPESGILLKASCPNLRLNLGLLFGVPLVPIKREYGL